jgi:hypothetical protein
MRESLAGLGLGWPQISARWLPILRETRMPAVHVTACSVLDAEQERTLADPATVERIAQALAEGLERFFTTGSREGADPARRREGAAPS